jgi:hypothetical protein
VCPESEKDYGFYVYADELIMREICKTNTVGKPVTFIL